MDSEEQSRVSRFDANLTLGEAAEVAHCSVEHEIPCCKIGRRWIIPAQQFQEWIEKRCQSPMRRPGYAGPSALVALLDRRLAARAMS